ncbi:MAG: hypothetical protein BWY83_01890 [bacterium ADurb.Bin478]|nr:MAG: hypothetical protein BWY83_01890 [bacterium ADurb.Bin478]
MALRHLLAAVSAGAGLPCQPLLQFNARVAQPLQPLSGRCNGRIGKIHRTAIMRLQNEKTDLLAAELFQRFRDGGKIAQRFAHLDAVHQHHVVVHPITDKRLAAGRFALRDFAFVMGKLILHAAAVNVKGFAQVFGRHGRALDVPAGKTAAPGAVPLHQVVFRRLFP